MNTPRSVTSLAGGESYVRLTGRDDAQRRARRGRVSPQSRTPRGRMRTKAVGTCNGNGLVTTSAA
jgi:hypothetical protein